MSEVNKEMKQNNPKEAKRFYYDFVRHSREGVAEIYSPTELLVAYAAQFQPKEVSDEEMEDMAHERAILIANHNWFVLGAKWLRDKMLKE